MGKFGDRSAIRAWVWRQLPVRASRILVAGLVTLGLILGGCGSATSSKGTDVVYGVVGSACSANITYQDLTRTQTVLTAVALPWHFEFTVPQSQVNGFPLFMTALNNCAVGSVTANVEVNEALFATQTTFAPNGLVQISVSLF